MAFGDVKGTWWSYVGVSINTLLLADFVAWSTTAFLLDVHNSQNRAR